MSPNTIVAIAFILLVANNFNETLAADTTANEVNVALGKPTNQSSTGYNGFSNLAIDGVEVANGIFWKDEQAYVAQCTRTSDTDVTTTPWWRVDLLEDYQVDRIVIFNRAEGLNFRLHDFDIRIGDFDIGQVGMNNERFTLNPVCVSYEDKFLGPGRTEIFCDKPLVGRYVSIQIFQFCKLDSCSDEKTFNLLTLCEVEVFGTPSCNNLALGKLTVQSSTALEGFSSLAVDSKINSDGIYYRHISAPVTLCTHNNIGESFPWWSVDLLEEFVVFKLVLYNRDEGLYTRLHDFEIRIGNVKNDVVGDQRITQNELCAAYVDRYAGIGKTEIQCTKRLFGRYVTIQIVKLCTIPSCISDAKQYNILTLCEVQVFGVKPSTGVCSGANLALGKPTFQSSTAFNGTSSLAVDGNKVKDAVYENPVSKKAQCTHTSAEGDDKTPYWYVDLQAEFIVERVVVYNRGENLENRLHDVEIRVGSNNKNITQNSLCKSFIGSYLAAGRTEISCSEPLAGQYVSIQITKLCTLPACSSPDRVRNILTLCEVEVYGFPSSNASMNVALGKPTSQSSVDFDGISYLAVDGNEVPDGVASSKDDFDVALCAHTNDKINEKFPWWRVDLGDDYIVDKVIIYNAGSGNNQSLSHDFEIRIGDRDIMALGNGNQRFTGNALCKAVFDTPLPEGKSEFKCQKSLIGRFVSVQITSQCSCTYSANVPPNVLILCEVQVCGNSKSQPCSEN